jgi:hypothetical protein
MKKMGKKAVHDGFLPSSLFSCSQADMRNMKNDAAASLADSRFICNTNNSRWRMMFASILHHQLCAAR